MRNHISKHLLKRYRPFILQASSQEAFKRFSCNMPELQSMPQLREKRSSSDSSSRNVNGTNSFTIRSNSTGIALRGKREQRSFRGLSAGRWRNHRAAFQRAAERSLVEGVRGRSGSSRSVSSSSSQRNR